MKRPSLLQRLRSKVAGWLFMAAGVLDEGYNVWLDDAPPRRK